MGAVPTNVIPSEMYMSLERGVLDGLASEPAYIVMVKLNELTKYWLDTELYGGATFFLATNKKVWNSFPSDIQKTLNACMTDFTNAQIESSITSREAMETAMKKSGVEFTTLSAAEMARWQEKSKPAYTAWLEQLDKLGIPGQKVLDAAKEVIASNK